MLKQLTQDGLNTITPMISGEIATSQMTNIVSKGNVFANLWSQASTFLNTIGVYRADTAEYFVNYNCTASQCSPYIDKY